MPPFIFVCEKHEYILLLLMMQSLLICMGLIKLSFHCTQYIKTTLEVYLNMQLEYIIISKRMKKRFSATKKNLLATLLI